MPTLDPAQRHARFTAARVARLATLRADGTARLVPMTFVLVDDLICSAVDELKPKRSTRLARLDDVRRDPRVGVLVDHYADDWSALWWVRIDGVAEVHHSGERPGPGTRRARPEVRGLRDDPAERGRPGRHPAAMDRVDGGPVIALVRDRAGHGRVSRKRSIARVVARRSSMCGAWPQSRTSSSTGPRTVSRTASTCAAVP